jgi:hypothetical protein
MYENIRLINHQDYDLNLRYEDATFTSSYCFGRRCQSPTISQSYSEATGLLVSLLDLTLYSSMKLQ